MGGKVGIRSEKRQRVVDFLDANPEGVHTRHIAALLGDKRDTALRMLSSMRDRGFVWQIVEWRSGATQARWYLHKHEAAAKAAASVAGIVNADERLSLEQKAERNIVPPRTPIVVHDAPRVIDSSQARPWAVAATARAHVSEAA
jgi:hypothetical protein